MAGIRGTTQMTSQTYTARRSWVAIGALLLVALVLRIYGLGVQSIWIDEAYSLRISAVNLAEIIRDTARDNHPPLYYLLLAGWMRVGPTTETWARLLSALLGVLLVGILYLVSRNLAPPPVPNLAAGLLALSPFAIWHSQDARMYLLLLVLAYLAVYEFLRFLEDGSRLRLPLFILFMIGALYTHTYAVFVGVALGVELWLGRRDTPPERFRGMALTLLASSALYLPWVWVILNQARLEAGFYKPITGLTIPYTLLVFSFGYTLGPSLLQLHRTPGVWPLLLGHVPVVLLGLLCFGGSALMGAASAPRALGRHARLVFLLVGFPLLLPIVVTLLTRIDFNARYAILALPPYLILLATGLATARPRFVAGVLGAAMLALMSMSLYNHFCDTAYAKEDSRSAYQLIRDEWKPGDCVLVLGVGAAFEYYERSPVHSEAVHFDTRARVSRSEELLRQSSRTCRRLWFVSGREWEEDPRAQAIPTLEKFFRPVGWREVQGIRIVELDNPQLSGNSWRGSPPRG